LYFRETQGDLLVVSEPIDDRAKGWQEVPKGCALVPAPAGRGGGVPQRSHGRLAA
jgi:glutamine amidotransferase